MKNPFKNPFAVAALFALFLFPAQSRAQGLGNVFDFLFGHQNHPSTRGLEKNVFSIDNLADQMTWRYGSELQRNCGCRDSIALFTQMKKHAGLTENLVNAYKGSCTVSFKRAACDVRGSVTSLERLSKRADVSSSVLALIDQSCPMATYIHNNAALFRPAVAVDPVYLNLGRNVEDIDRLANQIAGLYSREASCGCRDTRALLSGMQKYTVLTGNLTTAYRGICPKTFKNAACEVRDSLTYLENLAKRVSVSSSVARLLEESCSKTTYVHNHASHFRPAARSTGSGYRVPDPVYLDTRAGWRKGY